MIYHVRQSALPLLLLLLEEVWLGFPPSSPLMKFRRRGSPGTACAATSAVLVHARTHARTGGRGVGRGRIALGILLMHLPCLGDLCSLCRCTAGLCGERLANIDSSRRTGRDQREWRGGEGGCLKGERE